MRIRDTKAFCVISTMMRLRTLGERSYAEPYRAHVRPATFAWGLSLRRARVKADGGTIARKSSPDREQIGQLNCRFIYH
jgi:hypothetical protein